MHWRLDAWTLFALAIALLVALPILFVAGSLFTNASDIWEHLATTVLGEYLRHSLWLVVGVGTGTAVIGVSTAWLVTTCRFPGCRCFEWGLLLPLAAPAYILAYAYTVMLDFFGPVQTGLRSVFGWQGFADYWFPNVQSLWGAIAMLILVLYPYVYLLARVAFLEQSRCTVEASRSLGYGPWRSFATVALPMARPAIASGLALVLMETLGDFGTVDYFGITTFTTGIYRTWFGMGDRAAASQLASVLMGFVLILLVLERWSRRQARYYQAGGPSPSPLQYRLDGLRAIGAMVACGVPIALGFGIPGCYLVYLTSSNLTQTLNRDFWTAASHSTGVAVLAAGLALAIAVVLAYGQRLQGTWLLRSGVRVAAMGYAIPGTVIAVGVLVPLGQFDNAFDRWMQVTLGISTGLLLSGTIAALVFAYLVRFLAVALGAVESSLARVRPNLDDAARGLGHGPGSTLARVHLPLMWGGLLTAVLLVFVDTMKELPATLVVRPFNFETLAVQAYRYASDERLIEAAAPALAVVLVGTLPVILLSVQIARDREMPHDRESIYG
ncbi:ABC transporter permease [Rubidibacter lacunae]|uniref:ABC transporter permease n=1 Tax=Rubidibacter lacunae TaxID=582514 RepID=UPI001E44FAC9|nr:iron ABC transporter permease [Rubidibacter lacunae]